jgi:hypothetical protein
MTATTSEKLRFAINGDIPEPTEFAYDTDAGEDIGLSGFTGTVTFRIDTGTSTTRSASVNSADSTVTVVWQSGDHTIASNGTGVLHGEVAVLSGVSAFWQRSFERVILPRQGG